MINKIQPPDQPTPKGHYSPGIEHNGLIFVSGQLPITLDTDWSYRRAAPALAAGTARIGRGLAGHAGPALARVRRGAVALGTGLASRGGALGRPWSTRAMGLSVAGLMVGFLVLAYR